MIRLVQPPAAAPGLRSMSFQLYGTHVDLVISFDSIESAQVARANFTAWATSKPAVETNERLYTEADVNAIVAARDALQAQKASAKATTSLSLYACRNCGKQFATMEVRDFHEEGCEIKQLSSSESDA